MLNDDVEVRLYVYMCGVLINRTHAVLTTVIYRHGQNLHANLLNNKLLYLMIDNTPMSANVDIY